VSLVVDATMARTPDSPAAAHARLLGSTPKDDSTVTEAVTQIQRTLRLDVLLRRDRFDIGLTAEHAALLPPTRGAPPDAERISSHMYRAMNRP
jgi:methionine-rich copper-binding protein CopC